MCTGNGSYPHGCSYRLNRGAAAMLAIPWVSVEPWSVPTPFSAMELTVHVYDLLVFISLVVGLLVAVWFAKTHRRSLRLTLSLALHLVAFSFPISALLNAVFYDPETLVGALKTPSQLWRFRFGLSSYGGIVGAVIGGLVWQSRHRGSLLRIGDAAAFAGPFGWAVGRLGCFLTHDHPGRRSDFLLAVADYRVGEPPYSARHDLGLYEMLVFLGIAAAFAFLPRKPRPDGFYVALLPLLYTPVRFALDVLRAPAFEGGDIRYGGLTPGQYASITLFIAGTVLMRRIATPRFTAEREGQ